MSFIHLFQKNETLKFWHRWLLSSRSRLLNWKGPETYPQSSKLFTWPLKIIALVYICQLPKSSYLMSFDLKIYSKIHPVSCTNVHHDVTDLVNQGMANKTKTWISWQPNMNFPQNKTILNLCFIWHILRSYRFLAEVTFNIFSKVKLRSLWCSKL